jgi:hypothetical protein
MGIFLFDYTACRIIPEHGFLGIAVKMGKGGSDHDLHITLKVAANPACTG